VGVLATVDGGSFVGAEEVKVGFGFAVVRMAINR